MKSIIFLSTQDVRAILDGRKTQTRCVMGPQPRIDADSMWHWRDCQWMDGGLGFPQSGVSDHAPHYPGDALWVREAWMPETEQGVSTGSYIYKASNKPEPDGDYPLHWRSPIHMPREAARIFLLVTSVRVEQVQEISEADARAEGLIGSGGGPSNEFKRSARMNFINLWDSINAKRGYGWDSNPWVWVYEFERISKEEAGHDQD